MSRADRTRAVASIAALIVLGACANPHEAAPAKPPPPPASPPASSTMPLAPPAALLQDASVELLAQAIASKPIVLLGEVHDNAAQHALRLQALRKVIEAGARPAIAFEQFDHGKQAALDTARRETEGKDTAQRVDRIVEVAGAHGWKWEFYKPYVALALEYNLPIVAANLSRMEAMRVGMDGAAAIFDANEIAALGLNSIDPALEKAQEHEVEEAHCGRTPTDSIAPMAQAQIARDAMLAQSIQAYFARGVILLTGNGHVRKDLGIPAHLAPADRARTVAIGLLENDDKAASMAVDFDIAMRTPAQPRKDPCALIPTHS
jgi:uncharacterized iron-regulated protein